MFPLQKGFQIVVVEGFADDVFIVFVEGIAVVIVAPAVAVGVFLAGVDGQTVGVDLGEDAALVLGCLGGQVHESLQGQAVQGHEVGDIGIADIQETQAFAAFQRIHIFQIVAVGQLQPGELLAVFKAGELLNGGAGGDDYFDIGHVADEGQVGEGLVMADVHVFDVLAVFHGAAGGVGDIVNGTEHFVIGEVGITVGDTVVDTPDHLGAGTEVFADLGQQFVVHAAVVQNETGAIVQNGEGLTDLGFALIADGIVLEDDLGIGGGEGFAVEGEIIVEGGLGAGVLKLGYMLHGKAVAEADRSEVREQAQLLGGFLHMGCIHGAQVQFRGGDVQGIAQEVHGVIQDDLGIGFPEGSNLRGGEGDAGEADVGDRGEILEILQECIKAEAACGEGQDGVFVGHHDTADVHGVGHIDVGMLPGIIVQGIEAGGTGQVHGLQVGVAVQGVQFTGLQNQGQGLYRFQAFGGLYHRGSGFCGSGGVGLCSLLGTAGSHGQRGGTGTEQAQGLFIKRSHGKNPPIGHSFYHYTTEKGKNQEIRRKQRKKKRAATAARLGDYWRPCS